jgi:hypothetical protein
MHGHTRLYRRGAVYYHRAAVPKDIAATYPKSEETFSLKTRDHAAALRKVRVEAVLTDNRFDEHRRWLAAQSAPFVDYLSACQLATIKQAYLHDLLDADADVRLEGIEEPDEIASGAEQRQHEPRPSFEEYSELADDMDAVTRRNLARGKQDNFYEGEAEDVLTWQGIEIRLDQSSSDWKKVVRVLQEAAVEASEAKRRRNSGDVVPTPPSPAYRTDSSPMTDSPMLTDAFARWLEQKTLSGRWSPKAEQDYRSWIALFVEVCGDRQINEYSKSDGRSFKDLLTKLPANWKKMPETRDGNPRWAVKKGAEYGLKWLCCTKRVRDSCSESSVVAGLHEQTDISDLQNHELG